MPLNSGKCDALSITADATILTKLNNRCVFEGVAAATARGASSPRDGCFCWLSKTPT